MLKLLEFQERQSIKRTEDSVVSSRVGPSIEFSNLTQTFIEPRLEKVIELEVESYQA